MKRVQVNSRTSTTNVFLTYPTLDANKQYSLTIEKLMVPALDSLLLNKQLFTVERRLLLGVNLFGGPEQLPLPEEFTTFTPQNVRTVSQLLFQMNRFFREMCRRLATVAIPYNVLQHQYVVPATFNQQNVDWFSGLVAAEPIETALQAVFRPDGKIGFRFSVDGLRLFVIKLSDEGQRIFARTQRYIALDQNGQFNINYAVGLLQPQANSALPAAVTEGYILVIDNSLFSHVNYRHELVLQTSLPLNNSVECDTDHSFYRRQLASYKFPDTKISMEYTQVMLRDLIEETQTMYSFEDSIRTHNKFQISGTELQNFNLYLVSRNYEYNAATGRYDQTEVPYDLHKDTFYTVQFALRPLK